MKKENPFEELIGSVRFMWRHRKGNETIGNIMDVFDNLDFTTKDKRKPHLISKRKTEYGWHLVFHLPPGISFSDVAKKREYFQDATNSWTVIEWLNGKMHMDIQCGELPEEVMYKWEPDKYKMDLPIPIGYTQKGLEVFDLSRAPHMLIGGSTGTGKSTYIHVLIHSLIRIAYIAIIDCKRLDFAYLKNHCALARSSSDAFLLLQAIEKEMNHRLDLLESAGVRNIQSYNKKNGGLPFIVVFIDELAELRNDEIIASIDRLSRLARAVGISLVAATQRPSVKVIPGDARMNFLARMCFKVPSEGDGRVILGDENGYLGARLPAIKGRAVFQLDTGGSTEKVVQVMNLPEEMAESLVTTYPIGGKWLNIEPEQPTKPKLKPR